MHMQAFNRPEFCASNSAEGHWLVLKSAWNSNSQYIYYMTVIDLIGNVIHVYFFSNVNSIFQWKLISVTYASLLPTFSLLYLHLFLTSLHSFESNIYI